MSTYWDLYCEDCNSFAGFHWNHGDKQLTKLWQEREAMVGLVKLFAVTTEIEVRWYGPESWPTNYEWFSSHSDHHVRPRNEYGQFLEDCIDRFKCEACGSYAPCERGYNHEGEHGKKRGPA